MTEVALNKFDKTVDRMKRQQTYGLSCYAFLSGLVDNSDRLAKYNGSYAGHALELCIGSVQSGLVLFCSRHWDDHDDFHSIPSAKAHADGALEDIVNRHRLYFESNGFERNADEFYGYFEDLSSKVQEVLDSPTRSQIRVLRTEEYAHLTANSRDRSRALSDHPVLDMDGLTIESLLVFSRRTIELSNRFVYLKERLVPEFDCRINHLSEYYNKFWDNLPVFSEVEGPL